MSKISFNYESSTLGTDSFSNDLDYEIATNKGNAYQLQPNTVYRFSVNSQINNTNFLLIGNYDNSQQFNSTINKKDTAMFQFYINGLAYTLVNERDSVNLNYSYASNKLNGTFSGRLTCPNNNDSLTVTNGVFEDVPLVQ